MRRTTTLALAMLAALAAVPPAASAAPPANDDYLRSLSFNQPGTALPRGKPDKLGVRLDTSEATTQADLFGPDATGGGAEVTTCRGQAFGKTAWFDLHPDVNGLVHLEVAGFPTAITAYEFDVRTSKITRPVDCVVQDGLSGEIFLDVRKGRHYTVQVGGLDTGAGPAGGPLELLEEFFPDRDADGVLDAVDRCPSVRGTSNGCPERLSVTALLTATATPRGIRVQTLRVTDAPAGARVRVRCRPGCGVRTQTRTVGRSRAVSFPRFSRRHVAAGRTIEVRVTRKDTIGQLFRYRVSPGAFRRVNRCIQPSGRVTTC